MDFVYKPGGEELLRWPYEPGKLMNPEAEIIEKRTGMLFPQWDTACRNGSMVAIHGLLFVLLKRQEPTLRWEQVSFSRDDVDFEMDDDELRDTVATMEAMAAQGVLPDEMLGTLASLKAGLAQLDPDDDPDGEAGESGESADEVGPTTPDAQSVSDEPSRTLSPEDDPTS